MTFDIIATVATFTASNIGDEIHMTMTDGRILRLRITAVADSTHATVEPNRDLPVDMVNIAITDWALAQKSFTGLSHLEGETVSILADGHVHAQQVVASGSLTLQYAATVVHVGLPIEADFETLDLSLPSTETIIDKQKIIPAVRFYVHESRGLVAGTDVDHLFEYKARNLENYDEPIDLLTGIAPVRVESTWTQGGRVFVRQSDPLPLSILAAIPEVEIGKAV